MNESQQRLAAVRDAYRLIHGYQTSVKRILEETLGAFSAAELWEWEPTGDGPVTGRKCPLSSHDAASFLPLLESYFYYTTRPATETIKPGHRVLYIQHHADTEFATDDGQLFTLDSNEYVKPATPQATSEIAVSLIVNLSGNTLTWWDIDQQWNEDVDLFPCLYCGEEVIGYTKDGQANEWALPKPVELGGHTLQVVASAEKLERLTNTGDIKKFIERLDERLGKLAISQNQQ